MRKPLVGTVLVVLAVGLGGCASLNPAGPGTYGGAVVGGTACAIGSHAPWPGQAAIIAGCAVAGGLLGNQTVDKK